MLFPPIALKAKWFVVICGVFELVLGLSHAGSNIAHFAHIGGMVFGFILIKIWQRKGKMYS
jgi:membrane associated rhomboid family serine protease